jgi:hypothetical protein
MEDILAVIFIFGGGTLVLTSFSPIGKAIAARIRGGGPAGEMAAQVLAEVDELRAQVAELEQLRAEVAELHERVDFAERLLAKKPASELPAPGA